MLLNKLTVMVTAGLLVLGSLAGVASAAGSDAAQIPTDPVDEDALKSLNFHEWCYIVYPAPPFQPVVAAYCSAADGLHRAIDKVAGSRALAEGGPLEQLCAIAYAPLLCGPGGLDVQVGP